MRVIAGEKRHLSLKTLDSLKLRPTTDKIKETLFNMIQFELSDINFLDLYAGSGAIGIEALSRGSRFCTFVDNDREAIEVINFNLDRTKLLDKAIVYKKDVVSFIDNNDDNKVYHIVFMDPPYEANLYKKTLTSLSKSNLIDENSIIIAESSIKENFDFATELNLDIIKIKEYKSNKHIFLKKR